MVSKEDSLKLIERVGKFRTISTGTIKDRTILFSFENQRRVYLRKDIVTNKKF